MYQPWCWENPGLIHLQVHPASIKWIHFLTKYCVQDLSRAVASTGLILQMKKKVFKFFFNIKVFLSIKFIHFIFLCYGRGYPFVTYSSVYYHPRKEWPCFLLLHLRGFYSIKGLRIWSFISWTWRTILDHHVTFQRVIFLTSIFTSCLLFFLF